MKYIIHNIKMPIDSEFEDLVSKIAKQFKIGKNDFKSFRVVKESIDARKKNDIHFVYSVVAEISSKTYRPHLNNDIRLLEEEQCQPISVGSKKLEKRPVVVGSGPCGLFAALYLARNGYKPILLERGAMVEERKKLVDEYWKSGSLNIETNVQFGEGGAGTFSDGKLTTRINDKRCDTILQELYQCGAPEEILYKAKPHIGTDILINVVQNIRKKIIELGGEVRFHSKVTSVSCPNGKVENIIVNNEEEIPCSVIILAIGHSARDTFESLFQNNIYFEQKPFSIGVRIEHPQELINKAQFGTYYNHPKLGAADYQLFEKFEKRTAYSFCMCPGGTVVASASEEKSIVTNGMSEYKRDKENANSAFVVSVLPSDFGERHPLAGIQFQRKWEKLAYEIAGRDNSAPIQKLGDFISGVKTSKLGSVKPSYTGATTFSDLNTCLPQDVCDSLKASVRCFDARLKGFGMSDALLTGVETRTSSPVRITRKENFESISVEGLYPAGEGAGYAGGIMSAAVDGIRVAEEIVKTYSNIII